MIHQATYIIQTKSSIIAHVKSGTKLGHGEKVNNGLIAPEGKFQDQDKIENKTSTTERQARKLLKNAGKVVV